MENEKKEWINEKTGKVEKYNYGRKPVEKVKHAEAIKAADEVQISPDTEQLLALADFYLTGGGSFANDTTETSAVEIGNHPPVDPKLNLTLDSKPKQSNNAKQTQNSNKNNKTAETGKTAESKTNANRQANGKKPGQKGKQGAAYSNRKKPNGAPTNQGQRKTEPKTEVRPSQVPADAKTQNDHVDVIAATVASIDAHINTGSMPELTRSSENQTHSHTAPKQQRNDNTSKPRNAEKSTSEDRKRRSPQSTASNTRKAPPAPRKQQESARVISWEEEEKLRIRAAERDGSITGLIMCFVMAVTYGIYMLMAQVFPTIAPDVLIGNLAEKIIGWVLDLAIVFLGC